MANVPDPFTGLKLSQHPPPPAQPVGRDQRLFTPSTQQHHEPSPKPVMTESAEVMTSKRHEPMTSPRQDVMDSKRHEVAQVLSPNGQTLALTRTPHRDFTLRITEEEYEALDDVERELRRTFGITTSKNNLIRCGIHFIIESQGTDKARSVVLNKLRQAATS